MEHPALDKLTEKQRQFVLRYLTHFNAARAAREAGYGEKCDRSVGAENLAKPDIKAAIAELLHIHGITADRLSIDLGEIAHGADVADFEALFNGTKTLTELRDEGVDTRLIKQIKATRRTIGHGDDAIDVEDVTLVLCDRQAALSKLVDVLGMVTQKHELSGEITFSQAMAELEGSENK